MCSEGERTTLALRQHRERRGTDGVSPMKFLKALIRLWTRVTNTEENDTNANKKKVGLLVDVATAKVLQVRNIDPPASLLTNVSAVVGCLKTKGCAALCIIRRMTNHLF